MASRFTLASLAVSFLVFISAALTFATSVWGFPETHPLAPVLSLVIFLIFLSEIPLIFFSRHLGFPLVLPAVSLIFAFIGFRRAEKARKLSILSLFLLLISVAFYLSLRTLTHAPGGKEIFLNSRP